MKFRGLWKTALLGSQHLLVLPVSPYMVVEQLEGHGLVDVRVVIQRPGDDVWNLERDKKPSADANNISDAGMTQGRQL
jgi:hypothetical protein